MDDQESDRMNSDVDDDNTMNVNSSSIVGNNIDILTLILLCLPLKSLLLFKFVSKLWFTIISDSSFICKHAVRNCSPPITELFIQNPFPSFLSALDSQLLALDKSNINVNSGPYLVNNISSDIKIIQSCNGLILYRKGRGGFTYYICNPTTGHKKILRPPRSTNFHSNNHHFGLAFNPIKSPFYEVIFMRVCSPIHGICHYHIQIYSSKTNSWRVSGEHMVEFSCPYILSGVFWNGLLHWMPESNRSHILYFDIEQELLKTMPMPPFPDEESEVEYFGEYKGHLYLIYKNDYSFEFDMFEMEIDHSGWSKKYHINLGPLAYTYFDESDHWYGFNVLLVGENKRDSFKLVLLLAGMFISYDLKDLSHIIYDTWPARFIGWDKPKWGLPLMRINVLTPLLLFD